MLAPSDTSPISNLASIGHLNLLQSQFGAVWISAAVREELTAHPDQAARQAIEQALQEQWLRVGQAPDSPMLRVLVAQLHRGEAESIALAAGLHADFVLIDEQEGRRIAGSSGLAVTGVLGVLLRAKRMGQVSAVKPLIDMLRDQAGFFVAPALELLILASAGE